MTIRLEKIVPTDAQIKSLHHQLAHRVHNISHHQTPSFDDHVRFVNNNPYREWFMVKRNDKDAGHLYVHSDNSIGLHPHADFSPEEIREVMNMVYAQVKPLEAIPSTRRGEFFLNVAASNTELQEKLSAIGYLEIQRSYVFREIREQH